MIAFPPGSPNITEDHLNRLIRQQGLGIHIAQAVIIDQIAQSITLDQQETDQLVADYLTARGLMGETGRNTYLEKEAINDEDLIWRATTARRLAAHRHNFHGPDVESHFLDRKLYLDQVVYSMIRVRDADLASELYQQIREGTADFEQLAPLYSEGLERNSRGLIGPVPLGAAHHELVSRLRIGQVGQLWEPFFVVDIWLVLRLEQRLTAQLDQAMRQQLELELFEAWCQQRLRELVAGEGLPAAQTQPT